MGESHQAVSWGFEGIFGTKHGRDRWMIEEQIEAPSKEMAGKMERRHLGQNWDIAMSEIANGGDHLT